MKTIDKLTDAIKKSRYILDLKYDWDDEGAEPYDPVVYQKAINMVLIIAASKNELEILTPKISHGVEGGIDVMFQEDSFRFLIATKVDGTATWYADDDKDLSAYCQGTFNLENIDINLLPSGLWR